MQHASSPMLSRRESHAHASVQPHATDFHSTELHQQPMASTAPRFRQTVVVRNRHGREEAFTIGPDGEVWGFFPDAVDAPDFSGYRLVSMCMPADQLTLGRNGLGSLVIVAIKGVQVCFREEIASPDGEDTRFASTRWSGIEYGTLPWITPIGGSNT